MFAARKTDGAVATTANYIEDVFSTYLYTGNGAAQTIPNGIALGSAYGGSVYFDGTGDYISAPANAAFNFGTGDFTVEFWYYPNAVAGARTLLDINYGTAPNFTLQPSFGVMLLYYNGGNTITSSATDTAGSWYHYAVVRSGSTITMYRNGTSVGTATYSGNVGNSSAACFVGGSLGGGGYYVQGYLSNFRIVKGTAVYTSTFTPPTAPLTAISGTSLLTCQTPNTVLDYSSNAFTITVTNAVAQNGGGPFTDSTANKGGLVWIKNRNNSRIHQLLDTVRGVWNALDSASTGASAADGSGLTAFNSNGFTIGSSSPYNFNTETFASWTFREQAKFFDVVTWTGNGGSGNRQITHNLGSVPGFITVKNTGALSSWRCYHRSLGANNALTLNSTPAASADSTFPADPTSTYFEINAGGVYNTNGNTYVAYLFAHDAGGFGLTGTDNVISCGSYTGAAATVTVNLGWEPQWVLIKRATGGTGNWVVLDNMRGVGPLDTTNITVANQLFPNLSDAETNAGSSNFGISATGFSVASGWGNGNAAAGSNYIYIAIRRGPMKTPTSGTSVFSPVARTGTSAAATMTAGFAPDAVFLSNRNRLFTNSNPFYDKLRGNNAILSSNNTGAEQDLSGSITQYTNTGITLGSDAFGNINGSGGTYINWIFQRAPGFFDVVCDTGTASAHTITHGLTVVPELMIRKKRNSATNSDWVVWHTAFTGTNKYLYLNSTAAEDTNSAFWTSTAPTSTVFSVGTGSRVNNTGDTYVTYLFASVNGVSKVGSYTGNGSNQTINCGFAAGARFVLIKRTSSTGDWYVWDTARGIVSGNDPRLSLNSTAAEVTTDDSIDPDNSGFIVNQLSATNINVNAATYIYLAIA